MFQAPVERAQTKPVLTFKPLPKTLVSESTIMNTSSEQARLNEESLFGGL